MLLELYPKSTQIAECAKTCVFVHTAIYACFGYGMCANPVYMVITDIYGLNMSENVSFWMTCLLKLVQNDVIFGQIWGAQKSGKNGVEKNQGSRFKVPKNEGQ